MKRLFAFISILMLSVMGGFTFGALLDVSPLIPGIVCFVSSFVPMPGASLYGLAFTAPGGIGVVFTNPLPYLPERLHWNDAGNPLTNLRISTAEEGVIHDFDAAAIAAMNGYLKVGPMAANDVTLNLATGHCIRNTTITGTTSAAGAINFYTYSDNKGQGGPCYPLKSQMDTIIALTPVVFQNFMALFIPTMATLTDYADVEFSDGHLQRMEIEDLISRSTDFQELPGIVIDNHLSYVHRVTIRTAANTPIYTLKIFIKGQGQ
jgi:hypothetical protein